MTFASDFRAFSWLEEGNGLMAVEQKNKSGNISDHFNYFRGSPLTTWNSPVLPHLIGCKHIQPCSSLLASNYYNEDRRLTCAYFAFHFWAANAKRVCGVLDDTPASGFTLPETRYCEHSCVSFCLDHLGCFSCRPLCSLQNRNSWRILPKTVALS